MLSLYNNINKKHFFSHFAQHFTLSLFEIIEQTDRAHRDGPISYRVVTAIISRFRVTSFERNLNPIFEFLVSVYRTRHSTDPVTLNQNICIYI